MGDGHGNTTVIRLQQSLAYSRRGERSSANDMFERWEEEEEEEEEDCIKVIMFSEQRDSKGEDSGELEENSESEGEAADDDGSDMIGAT